MSSSSTTGSACTRAWATAPRPRPGPAWKGSTCARPRDVLIPPLHSSGGGPVRVPGRVTTLLLVAEWVHLAQCVLLTGAFSLLVLAGPPTTGVARRWERRVLGAARGFVVVALASGVVVLAAQTALFEGRPEAAFEPGAIWRAMLDTRPGVSWMARNGLLVVLGALIVPGGDVEARPDWVAARGEALALSALALVLTGTSSHATAGSESPWPAAAAVAHLLAAGVWA